MEEKETSFKTLKDQLNSLKPVSSMNIDLADYNSYQFSRTMKSLKPIKESEGDSRTLLKPRSKEAIPRACSTRDISYRKDIPNMSHHHKCNKEDIAEKIRNLGLTTLPIGSATSYAKHRRTGSMGNMKTDKSTPPTSYPTDIKHLEKLIQFTGANHRNLSGGRACNRQS